MSYSPAQTTPLPQPAAARRADAWRAAAVSGLLLLGTVALFTRTAQQGFSYIDDNVYVHGEPHVTAGLTWPGVRWAFTAGPVGEWYPLTMLSHMLDCQLYKMKPAGHHVTNVLLHAAATVLLFLVLWRMTDWLWPSAMVAALFGFHPLHVEPVAWIAQRRDVLSGLFFVLTLGGYDHYTRQPRSLARFLVVVGVYALGLLSKPILVTMPALLLLLDYWPLGRIASLPLRTTAVPRPLQSAPRLFAEKLPLLALALGVAALTMHTHSMRPDSLTFSDRLANALVSCSVYLGQLFVPIGLSIFNSHPEAGRPVWQIIACPALLLAITAAAAISWRKFPYLLVGWLWYLGLLVPVLGLVFVGPQARADRYTYLSQIGLYLALVWGVVDLSARWPARRWLLPIGAAAIVVAMLAASWRQLDFWRTNQALMEHAVACDPTSATSHCMLGAVLEEEEHDENAAAAEYRRALEIVPGGRMIYAWPRAKSHARLGNFAAHVGEQAEAAKEYRQAIELDPHYNPARMELALLLARSGRLDEAIDEFKQAIAASPAEAPPIWCNVGTALLEQGKTDEAVAAFQKALSGDARLVIAHVNLARIADERGKTDEAIDYLQAAIRINPGDPRLYDPLARLLRKQGRYAEAEKVERRRDEAAQRPPGG